MYVASEDGFAEWLRNLGKLLCEKFGFHGGLSVAKCHDNSDNTHVILKFDVIPYFGVQLKTVRRQQAHQ